MMAQRCASVCFKPINRQITQWTSRSRLYIRANYIRCETYPQAVRNNVSSHWLSRSRKPPIQSTHMVCSSLADAKTKDKREFNLIYKFPGIRICKALSKLKILQTALTFTILPPVYYFYWQGQITEFAAAYSTGIAVFAAAMLYSITYFLRRIVGVMYVKKDATTLLVSHLTFWGNRKDSYFPVEDLKRLSETGDSKGGVFYRLKRYSSPDTFYFTLQYGQVVDKENFRLIFGEIK